MARPTSHALRLEVVERHVAGESLPSIAAALQLNPYTVRRFWRLYQQPRLGGARSSAARPAPLRPARQRPPAHQVCLAAAQTAASWLGGRQTAARTHPPPLASGSRDPAALGAGAAIWHSLARACVDRGARRPRARPLLWRRMPASRISAGRWILKATSRLPAAPCASLRFWSAIAPVVRHWAEPSTPSVAVAIAPVSVRVMCKPTCARCFAAGACPIHCGWIVMRCSWAAAAWNGPGRCCCG